MGALGDHEYVIITLQLTRGTNPVLNPAGLCQNLNPALKTRNHTPTLAP